MIRLPAIQHEAICPRQARQRLRARRGIALVDVIIGSMLLAIGLAVVISLTSRALKTQTDGEKRLIAAWLADELLSMVLVEGVSDYSKTHDTSGRCDAPFGDFEYDLTLEDQGIGEPFRVTASIHWLGVSGVSAIQVQTLMCDSGDNPSEVRAPTEPIDRDQRWLDREQKK